MGGVHRFPIFIYMKSLTLISLIIIPTVLISQDQELDLDAMWENTVWEEIVNVSDESYEVEKVTAVAGVRGAEAEDEALEHLNMRMPAESTLLVVAAMRIAARTGGNLAEALDSIAHTLQARLRLQGRVQALTSQGRLQAWIMGALPLLLLAVLDWLEPDAMAPLWHTPQGWAVLALVATLEVLGLWLIRRIVQVDV